MILPFRLLLPLILIGALSLIRADESALAIVWGPADNIVTGHTAAAGLEGGQVPFSLDEERNPPSLYTAEGFPYFGGVSTDGQVTTWRVLNEGPDSGNDVIDFLASDLKPGGHATMFVVWKCSPESDGKYPQLRKESPFFLRGYFSGSSMVFRGQVRFAVLDGEGHWWISEADRLTNLPVEVSLADRDDIKWSVYHPETDLAQVGIAKSGRPESVQAVGVWLSVENFSENSVDTVGAAIVAFRANLAPSLP